MHAAIALILVLACASLLARTVRRAYAASGGQARPGLTRGHRGQAVHPVPGTRPALARGGLRPPGTGWLEHRRRLALERLRHEHATARDAARARAAIVRDWARHAIRMREREAAMPPVTVVTDTPVTPPDPASPRAERHRTIFGTVEPDGTPASPVPPQQTPTPAPAPAAGPAPAPGGTVTTGTAGAVEQVIDGINGIHAAALAGNINAKQAAVKAAAEAMTRFAAMFDMLAREMSEPGMNYGPDITEPIASAGTHAQAAAMVLGDADAALTTLISMGVGELADSPRQAPSSGELTETGAR